MPFVRLELLGDHRSRWKPRGRLSLERIGLRDKSFLASLRGTWEDI